MHARDSRGGRASAGSLLLAVTFAACATPSTTRPPKMPRRAQHPMTVLLAAPAQIHTTCVRTWLSGWGARLRDATVIALRDLGHAVVSDPGRPYEVAALLTGEVRGCADPSRSTGVVRLALVHRGQIAVEGRATFRPSKVPADDEVGRLVDAYTAKLAAKLVGRVRTDQRLIELAASLARRRARQRPAGEALPARRGRPVVAVFDIEDASGRLQPASVAELSAYFVARLAEGRYRLVPQPQLRARLKRAKLATYRDCYDRACQIELGKALAAQKTFSTRVLSMGSRCIVSGVLYDLASETTDRAASVESSCTAAGLLGAVDQLARRVSALAGGKPATARGLPSSDLGPAE